jgi:acyl CoA:acetate/3-ketoacid CoA transferase beta subunit
MILREIAPDTTVDEIRKVTEADFVVHDPLIVMED